ncbi:MAG: SIS domain-containing protein [Candidatus Thorarchaeota archaeon]
MTRENFRDRFQKTMIEIANQVEINSILSQNDNIINIFNAILEIYKRNRIVFIYGAGRSGFVGRCFAQRLMHLGIRSCFISDAITYQYTNEDLLILISGSGETTSTVAMEKKARKIGGKITLFGSNPKSTIGEIADHVIEIQGKSKDMATSQESLAPYTSLFDISTLAVLDSLGGLLMNKLDVTEVDIDNRHATIE